jgi:hypothetical protein
MIPGTRYTDHFGSSFVPRSGSPASSYHQYDFPRAARSAGRLSANMRDQPGRAEPLAILRSRLNQLSQMPLRTVWVIVTLLGLTGSVVLGYWTSRLALRGALRDHYQWVQAQELRREFPEEFTEAPQV